MYTHLFNSLLVVAFALFGILTNSVNWTTMDFTCQNYLLNCYLFYLLSIGFFMASMITFSNLQLNTKEIFSSGINIVLLAIVIGVFVLTFNLNIDNFFLKNILWLINIALIGFLLYPMYMNYEHQSLKILYSTIAIFIILAIISFINPDFLDNNTFNKSIGIVSLFLGIVWFLEKHMVFHSPANGLSISVGNVFHLKRPYNENPWFSRIAYIFIVVFLLSDAFDIKQNSKICVEGQADYVGEAMGLIADFFGWKLVNQIGNEVKARV